MQNLGHASLEQKLQSSPQLAELQSVVLPDALSESLLITARQLTR